MKIDKTYRRNGWHAQWRKVDSFWWWNAWSHFRVGPSRWSVILPK